MLPRRNALQDDGHVNGAVQIDGDLNHLLSATPGLGSTFDIRDIGVVCLSL
jgi:hypothetical protein